MRVLVLVPHFAPRFEGGTEVVARAQALALARRGHAVRVVAGCDTPHAGADAEPASVDGLSVEFLPRLESERYDLLLERPRLRGLVLARAEGVDAVHLHGWATLAGDLVRALAPRVPVVVTLHDLFVTCPRFFRLPVGAVERCPDPGDVEPCVRCVAPDAPGVPTEALRTGLRARAAAWQAELDAATAVVLPSEAQRARLAALVALDPARTHVVPHGLCRPLAPPASGAAAALPWDGTGALRVLFLGNVTAVKGVLDLAAAVARVAAAGRAVELLVAGRTVEPGCEAALHAAAGAARVRALGGYEPGDLAARVAAAGGAHLAVLPSRAYESYGLVVDEALGLGLPTWVSDRGAPPERVGAAGRVVPAGDVQALAAALVEAHAEPDLLARQRVAAATPRPGPDAAAAVLEGLLRRAGTGSRPAG